jgi:hypothetical protein
VDRFLANGKTSLWNPNRSHGPLLKPIFSETLINSGWCPSRFGHSASLSESTVCCLSLLPSYDTRPMQTTPLVGVSMSCVGFFRRCHSTRRAQASEYVNRGSLKDRKASWSNRRVLGHFQFSYIIWRMLGLSSLSCEVLRRVRSAPRFVANIWSVALGCASQ